jgi:hypothetical protein
VTQKARLRTSLIDSQSDRYPVGLAPSWTVRVDIYLQHRKPLVCIRNLITLDNARLSQSLDIVHSIEKLKQCIVYRVLDFPRVLINIYEPGCPSILLNRSSFEMTLNKSIHSDIE